MSPSMMMEMPLRKSLVSMRKDKTPVRESKKSIPYLPVFGKNTDDACSGKRAGLRARRGETRAMPTSYPFDAESKVSTPERRRRRQFLKGSVGTAVAAALAYVGWTKYLFPPDQSPPPSGTNSAAGGIRLGPVSDFPT